MSNPRALRATSMPVCPRPTIPNVASPTSAPASAWDETPIPTCQPAPSGLTRLRGERQRG